MTTPNPTGRPETLADLRPAALRSLEPRAVVQVYDWRALAKLPGALRHLGALLDDLRDVAGVIVTADSITLPVTAKERASVLADEQSLYDHGHALHAKAVAAGVLPESSWDQYQIEKYCEYSGAPAPVPTPPEPTLVK